jgi:hypothetical protein
MPKVYHLTAEQILNLRNNLIISEALEDTQTANRADDYNDYSMQNVNKEPPEDVTPEEKSESGIFGDITKGLYNYANSYDLPVRVAAEITKENPKISTATSKEFIEKLLYGIYRMSSDPAQNETFDRFLHTIGVTLDGNLLTNELT